MFVFKSSDIRRKGQRRLATIVGDYPPFQINLIVTVLHAAAAPLKANCQQEEQGINQDRSRELHTHNLFLVNDTKTNKGILPDYFSKVVIRIFIL